MKKDVKKELSEHVFNHESELNVDELWSDVRGELFPKRRRKIFIWLFPLICVTAFSGYFISKNLKTQNTPEQVTEQFTTHQIEHNYTAKTELDNSQSLLEDSKEVTVKNEQNNIETEAKKKTIKLTVENNNLELLTETGKQKQIAEYSVNTRTTPINNTLLQTNEHKQIAQSTIFSEAKNIEVEEIGLLPKLNKQQNIIYDKTQELPSSFTLIKPQSYFSRWNLGLAFGVGYYDSERKSVLGIDHQEKLNSSYDPLEYLSGQFSVSYKLTKNFFVETGVNFTRFTEVIRINEQFIEDKNGGFVGTSETDTEGNTVANFGDNAYVKQINRNGQAFNNLDLIDLPLSIGYSWRVGKLRSDLSAGILINLYSAKEGHRFNADLLSETLSPDGAMPAVDLGYSLAIGFSYPVIGALNLDAGISGFQRQINYSYYTEKQKAVGASLGLSVLF